MCPTSDIVFLEPNTWFLVQKAWLYWSIRDVIISSLLYHWMLVITHAFDSIFDMLGNHFV